MELIRNYRARRSYVLSYAFLTSIACLLLAGTPSLADGVQPWAMGLQQSNSPIMDEIIGFYEFINWIIFSIFIFVVGLVVFILYRFHERRNPSPSRVTHHTGLEFIWTVVPCLILLVIAIPSLRLLDNQLLIPDGKRTYQGEVLPAPSLTIKATGSQWYWTYGYHLSDSVDFEYDSIMLDDEQLTEARAERRDAGIPRLLGVDEQLVIPVGQTVRLQVTAGINDVLHSFALPAFGIKIDAVPGRLNETWFVASRTGTYYGQCSELCGGDHAFMPISVRVVETDEFSSWLRTMHEEYAEYNPSPDGAGRTAHLNAK